MVEREWFENGSGLGPGWLFSLGGGIWLLLPPACFWGYLGSLGIGGVGETLSIGVWYSILGPEACQVEMQEGGVPQADPV